MIPLKRSKLDEMKEAGELGTVELTHAKRLLEVLPTECPTDDYEQMRNHLAIRAVRIGEFTPGSLATLKILTLRALTRWQCSIARRAASMALGTRCLCATATATS